MSAGLLARDRTILVLVDLQEGFRNVIDRFEDVLANAVILARAARILGLPLLATEQYPRGLGETVPELARHLDGARPVEKVSFSAAHAEGFELAGRDQVLVCGIEAHICVSQTVHDLLDQGRQVHIARDAVSSRTSANRQLGLEKMERAGALHSSTETAVFELLGRAGTQEFKAIQELIR